MAYPSKFVEFFGPSLWKSLHSIAFNYGSDPNHPKPEEHKAALDFFTSLTHLIPCGACSRHYEAYLARHPVDASSRDALARWVYDLHSDVNKRRRVKNPDYDEVVAMYAGWNGDKMKSLTLLSEEKRRRVSGGLPTHTLANRLRCQPRGPWGGC